MMNGRGAVELHTEHIHFGGHERRNLKTNLNARVRDRV